MFSKLFFASALALSTSLVAEAAVADTVAALRAAPNVVEQVKLLKDEDFVFDFLTASAGVTTGAGGRAVGATVANFPALVGQGVAMTVGFLDACAMNTPHTHPRATEILYAVNGTLSTGTIGENGSRFVFNTVETGQATVFPQGSVHFQVNEGCEPMTFVSAFNFEDPGTLSIAQRYFGLTPSVVGASLGNLGVQEVADLEALIPDNIAFGPDECFKRCGLTRPEQPTKQRQPRVSGNALPSTASSTASSTPSATASTSASSSEATSTPKARRAYIEYPTVEIVDAKTIMSTQASASQSFATTTYFDSWTAMVMLTTAMGLGYVVLAIIYLRDRSRKHNQRGLRLTEAEREGEYERYADKPAVVYA